MSPATAETLAAHLEIRIVPFSRYVAFAAWTHVKQGELQNLRPTESADSAGTPGDRAMTLFEASDPGQFDPRPAIAGRP